MKQIVRILTLFLLVPIIAAPMVFVNADFSSVAQAAPDSTGNIQTAVMLSYDNYFPTISVDTMHRTLVSALSYLNATGFPMDKVMVVTWLNTFTNTTDFSWLVSTLKKYDVSLDRAQFGLLMGSPETNDAALLNSSLATFNDSLGWYPYFVAGFSASSSTYSQLVAYGVKVSFFNLWQDGEDYSYRGYSTGDHIYGANWQGSPFQPYKPSRFSANEPGQTAADELDIWEAGWVTRNPSYAYLVSNSAGMGSIHPHDLLLKYGNGSGFCTPSEAIQKLNSILDLYDANARYNALLTISYPVECSELVNPDIFSVWRSTIKEFVARGYKFVDAVELRNNLEGLRPSSPHTPTYVWYDNSTSSDVVNSNNLPFAMVSSSYGRFIYAQEDPFNDSGSPLLSVVSYTTATSYNDSFQSIRELMGSDDFKVNTFVNGTPIEMRWINDIQSVTVTPGSSITIYWKYMKSEVPYVSFDVTTTLTPYGVLLQKDLIFKKDVVAAVSIRHAVDVQASSPTPLSDIGTWAESDGGDVVHFSSVNPAAVETTLHVSRSLVFVASDSYTLGVTLLSGKPDVIAVYDEPKGGPYEMLEFNYLPKEYHSSQQLALFYAFTPTPSLYDADHFASLVQETAQKSLKNSIPVLTPNSSSGSSSGGSQTVYINIIYGAAFLALLIIGIIVYIWIRSPKGHARTQMKTAQDSGNAGSTTMTYLAR